MRIYGIFCLWFLMEFNILVIQNTHSFVVYSMKRFLVIDKTSNNITNNVVTSLGQDFNSNVNKAYFIPTLFFLLFLC